MKTTQKKSGLLLAGMLAAVLTFGTLLTGCATTAGAPMQPAMLSIFDPTIPKEIKEHTISSYKAFFGVWVEPSAKVAYESKLKGLQENKDYYVVVTQAIFVTTISAVAR